MSDPEVLKQILRDAKQEIETWPQWMRSQEPALRERESRQATEGKMNITKANYEYFPVRNLAGEIMEEVQRSGSLFAPMNSPHEAAFVIEEEWEEYRQEVFKHNTSKPDRDTRPRQREELIQLAAMCIRAILDTIDKEKV